MTTTSKGLLIRFPLAVLNPEQDQEKKVIWYQIMSTSKYTEKMQAANLKKGQSVQVVGYVHEKKARTGSRNEKARTEIYAVSVKPVGNQSPPK